MTARPEPDLKEVVAYLSFEELIKDGTNVQRPWVCLRATPQCLAVGFIDEKLDVAIKVIFDGSFHPLITRYGFTVKGKTFNAEKVKLKSILSDLDKTQWCPGGISRARKCPIAVQVTGICQHCQDVPVNIKAKAPLSKIQTPVLIQKFKEQRLVISSTNNQLEKIRKALDDLRKEKLEVSPQVQDGLQQVLLENESSITDPFLQLFWKEQQKAASVHPNGRRWHPMLIRFAIFLHATSNKAYEALRDTGVLCLPNQSTLRDYSNFFAPGEGYQPHVLQHEETSLATHVLVFMLVGINNHLKMPLAYFALQNSTAGTMFPLLWEGVSRVEQQGLKVISDTSDKAAANQQLYRLHGDGKIVSETVNLYSVEERPFYFLSDAPHIMKTVRNNLEMSKYCGRRCLWNEEDILWKTVVEVYKDDIAGELRKTKLGHDHVSLTPASRMSVKLAVQVLSNSVGKVLQEKQQHAIADFVLMFDRFFDCLNVRSFIEYEVKKKPDLAPYKTVDDPRFDFLASVITYLDSWRSKVEGRMGYTVSEKDHMFIARPTYDGIVTTVQGFTGAARYLLNNGVDYLFSQVFCQDALEEHFGKHRSAGRRNRNPSIFEYGHQENRLRIQRDLAFTFRPQGNTKGRKSEKNPIEVNNEPLQKIKRP